MATATSGEIYTLQTKPTPMIGITPSIGAVTVSGTIPSTNFVLQQSSDMTSWSDMPDEPVLNLTNPQNQVALPMSTSNGFFRLKTP